MVYERCVICQNDKFTTLFAIQPKEGTGFIFLKLNEGNLVAKMSLNKLHSLALMK